MSSRCTGAKARTLIEDRIADRARLLIGVRSEQRAQPFVPEQLTVR